MLHEQLRRMTAQSVLFGDAVAKRAGLNGSDLECLDFVHLRKGATAGELARETGLTTGAITGVIDRLEKAGYVHREADPNDRRKVIVRARQEGAGHLAALYEDLQREMTALMSQYTTEQLKLIADFVGRAYGITVTATARLKENSDEGGK